MNGKVVPMACFTGVTKLGVTKLAAAKGPAAVPIIPGVTIPARLQIARRCQREVEEPEAAEVVARDLM